MQMFVVYTGSEGQTLSDQLEKDGRPHDVSADTVRFYMRESTSSTLKVNDEAASFVNDGTDGRVSYEWTDDDLDTPGEYYGWWRIIQPDTSEIDTNEFLIIITQHAPGRRTETGAFYRKAQSKLPTTWNALADWDQYGDSFLQEQIEVIKKRVFSDVPAVGEEIEQDIRVQEYVGKLAAIAVIPTGVDYWLNRHQTVSATGTNEQTSFPDRIDALWKIHARLVAEVAADRSEIEDLLDIPPSASSNETPAFSAGTKEGFKTPLPGEDFYDYSFPSSSDTLW